MADDPRQPRDPRLDVLGDHIDRFFNGDATGVERAFMFVLVAMPLDGVPTRSTTLLTNLDDETIVPGLLREISTFFEE